MFLNLLMKTKSKGETSLLERTNETINDNSQDLKNK